MLRLADLDNVLDGLALRRLPSLGDLSLGQPQLTDVLDIKKHGPFTDITFRIEFPNGKSHNYVIRFNQNGSKGTGAVFAVRVNGRFAFGKSFRSGIGEEITEAFRGFRDASDTTNESAMLRELVEEVIGEELFRVANISSVHLGDLFEFSGTHNVVSSQFLVDVEVPDTWQKEIRGSEDGIAIVYMDRDEVDLQRRGFGVFRDNFTLAVLSLALAHIDEQST